MNNAPSRVTFLRETLNEIACNLGISQPWTLSVPELKASIYNASCNVAPIRKVSA